MFVPFWPHIVPWALEHWQRPDPPPPAWYYYQDWVYAHLDYEIVGYTAKRRPKISPFWQAILDSSKK
jgi:hypothetical protein